MTYAMFPTNPADELDAEVRADPRTWSVRREDCGPDYIMDASLLDVFRESCATHHRWCVGPCMIVRQSVYVALMERYGIDAVMRWQPHIKAVLDRAEAEVEHEARLKDLWDDYYAAVG